LDQLVRGRVEELLRMLVGGGDKLYRDGAICEPELYRGGAICEPEL